MSRWSWNNLFWPDRVPGPHFQCFFGSLSPLAKNLILVKTNIGFPLGCVSLAAEVVKEQLLQENGEFVGWHSTNWLQSVTPSSTLSIPFHIKVSLRIFLHACGSTTKKPHFHQEALLWRVKASTSYVVHEGFIPSNMLKACLLCIWGFSPFISRSLQIGPS